VVLGTTLSPSSIFHANVNADVARLLLKTRGMTSSALATKRNSTENNAPAARWGSAMIGSEHHAAGKVVLRTRCVVPLLLTSTAAPSPKASSAEDDNVPPSSSSRQQKRWWWNLRDQQLGAPSNFGVSLSSSPGKVDHPWHIGLSWMEPLSVPFRRKNAGSDTSGNDEKSSLLSELAAHRPWLPRLTLAVTPKFSMATDGNEKKVQQQEQQKDLRPSRNDINNENNHHYALSLSGSYDFSNSPTSNSMQWGLVWKKVRVCTMRRAFNVLGLSNFRASCTIVGVELCRCCTGRANSSFFPSLRTTDLP